MLNGVMKKKAPFKLQPQILASPQFLDAMYFDTCYNMDINYINWYTSRNTSKKKSGQTEY